MLALIPFAAFTLTLVTAFVLARADRQDALAVVASALTLAAGLAFWKEGTTAGVDVLVYTAFLWGVALPGGVALVIGALLGRWQAA